MKAAVVDMLNVPLPSPPVPQRSTAVSLSQSIFSALLQKGLRNAGYLGNGFPLHAKRRKKGGHLAFGKFPLHHKVKDRGHFFFREVSRLPQALRLPQLSSPNSPSLHTFSDFIKNAVYKRGGGLRPELLGHFDRLIYSNRQGYIAQENDLANREAQNVPVYHGHSRHPPVFRSICLTMPSMASIFSKTPRQSSKRKFKRFAVRRFVMK